MPAYRVALNMEWTSKCNARCVMCPQELIQSPQLMPRDTFEQALARISPRDAFRIVIAGYGEPTTHPLFMDYVAAIGDHPARFDMVSNGQLLSKERLRHMDGRLGVLIISFSSIEPAVYEKVHVNLDHETVKANIRLAQRTLKQTRLGISLTPLAACIETLPQTIEWLKAQGVEHLSMSPTLYNRAGNMTEHEHATRRLREIIKRYGLHSQEQDFIPSVRDIALQHWRNRFRCMPRNSDLFITAGGHYLYCYNDITHRHAFGHVSEMTVREALAKREKMARLDDLCGGCNMQDRYRLGEVSRVAVNYLRSRLAARSA